MAKFAIAIRTSISAVRHNHVTADDLEQAASIVGDMIQEKISREIVGEPLSPELVPLSTETLEREIGEVSELFDPEGHWVPQFSDWYYNIDDMGVEKDESYEAAEVTA